MADGIPVPVDMDNHGFVGRGKADWARRACVCRSRERRWAR